MRIHRPICVILAAVTAAAAFAADTSLWTNLEILKPGTGIGIVQSDAKRIEGRFVSVTESALTFRGDREITVPKEKVICVYRRPRHRRSVRAAAGAAIGVIAGVILNGTVGARYRNEGLDAPSAPWIAGGAGIGAGIGAITGGGYHTVYQRKVP